MNEKAERKEERDACSGCLTGFNDNTPTEEQRGGPHKRTLALHRAGGMCERGPCGARHLGMGRAVSVCAAWGRLYPSTVR
jgi:hypothetical protein